MRFLAPRGARNDRGKEDIIWRGIKGHENFAGTIKPRHNKTTKSLSFRAKRGNSKKEKNINQLKK